MLFTFSLFLTHGPFTILAYISESLSPLCQALLSNASIVILSTVSGGSDFWVVRHLKQVWVVCDTFKWNPSFVHLTSSCNHALLLALVTLTISCMDFTWGSASYHISLLVNDVTIFNAFFRWLSLLMRFLLLTTFFSPGRFKLIA